MDETPEQFARRARRWIRIHPEEVIRTLLEAGRLPRCRCYDNIVEDTVAPYVEDFDDDTEL